MSLKKRLLKAPATIAMISWLLAMYIRLVYFTSRKIRHIDPGAESYMNGDANGIFAFWHGRMMLMLPFRPPKRKMHVLSTPHRDGQLSSRIVRVFGNHTIYGSSTRGGHSAVREMLRVLKAGDNISITPEGPRGPVQVVQKGTMAIAKLSGKPVIPVTFSSTRQKRFNSWDRFILPLPFGRIVFCVGAPIMVSREGDEEQMRTAIERSMNDLVENADILTSPSPLPPSLGDAKGSVSIPAELGRTSEGESGVRGKPQSPALKITPPPSPLPQGEGENRGTHA